MPGTTDIIARLQLRAEQFSSETGKAFGDMRSRAESTAQQVRGSFNTSFAEVQRLAEGALKFDRTDTGSLNLAPEIASLRESAAAAEQRAIGLRELAIAADAAAAKEGINTQAMRLNADAASVAALAAERDVQATREQIAALETLQNELNQTTSETKRLTQAEGQANNGARAFAIQNLGYQFSDFAVQVAGGTSAIRAFAQQAPQAAGALTGFGGVLGTVGRFLNGPIGIGLTVATTLLVGFSDKLFGAGEAGKAAGKGLDAATTAADRFAAALRGVQDANNRMSPASALMTEVTRLKYEISALERRPGTTRTGGDVPARLAAARADLAKAEAALQADQVRTTAAARISAANSSADEARRRAERSHQATLREGEKASEQAAKRLAGIWEQIDFGQRNLAATLKDVAPKLDLSMWRDAPVKETTLPDIVSGIDNRTDLRLEAAGRAAGEAFGDGAQASIRQVSETLQSALGLRLGGGASRLLSIAGSGPANDNDPFAAGLKSVFDPLERALGGVVGSVDGAFKNGGSFKRTLGEFAGSAALGSLGGGAFSSITGGKENKLASAIGGVLGKEAGGALGKTISTAVGGTLGKSLGGLAGPLGSIAGGILGNVVTGLFQKTKYGSSTIGYSNGQFSAGTTVGNSGSREAASSAAASSVAKGLQQIADQLGASITGAPNLTIGTYKDSYRVSTTGYQGKLNFKGTSAAGLYDFGNDESAAIQFAIKQSVSGAVIKGISQASINILRSGQDFTAAVTKAGLIEAVPKDLKAMLDPVGAAVDELNRKFQKTVDALKEGGATAEQLTDAERLYKLQLDQVKASTASASQGLKDFLGTLKVGSNSPLSLRDQEVAAKATLQPFLDQINAGSAIDQSKYQSAAQGYLDIERQLYGSTQAYFDAFEGIQAATAKAIATIDNATPISAGVESPFASKTADATSATAANTAAANDVADQQTEILLRIAQGIESLGGSAGDLSGFIGATRSYS